MHHGQVSSRVPESPALSLKSVPLSLPPLVCLPTARSCQRSLLTLASDPWSRPGTPPYQLVSPENMCPICPSHVQRSLMSPSPVLTLTCPALPQTWPAGLEMQTDWFIMGQPWARRSCTRTTGILGNHDITHLGFWPNSASHFPWQMSMLPYL